MVECQLPKLDVRGSNPLARSENTSLVAEISVAYLPTAGTAASKPLLAHSFARCYRANRLDFKGRTHTVGPPKRAARPHRFML